MITLAALLVGGEMQNVREPVHLSHSSSTEARSA